MSASLNWIAWKVAIGFPNCTLSLAYSTASSRAARPIPQAWAPMPIRPASRPESICLNPWPGFPSRFSAGTSASSKTSSAVPEARSPIFSSTFPIRNPGVFFRSTIRLMIAR